MIDTNMSSVTLNNSVDIVANSVSVIKGQQVIDLLDTVNAVKGLAPTTLDSLEKLASAMDNNPEFYTTVAQAIDQKADQTYTDQQLSQKANVTNVYNKTETDGFLAAKANASNVYTKAESDTNLSNLVGAAPAALNTLNELASALGNDANYATTVINQLSLKANTSEIYSKNAIDLQLSAKADTTTTYTKAQTDTFLALKADQTTTFSKNETTNLLSDERTYTDGQLSLKANAADVYTKTTSDAQLLAKADASAVYTKTQTDTFLESKANQSTTFTKDQTTNLLNTAQAYTDGQLLLKANASDFYTKNSIDLQLLAKADASTTYTKTEVNNALNGKADQSTTYTKTQVDTLLGDKAFTTYVDARLALKADTSNTYTKTQVDASLAPKAATSYVDTQLALKANQSTTYTKTDVDSKLDDKQNALLFTIPASGESLTNDGQVVKAIAVNAPLTITSTINTITIGTSPTLLNPFWAAGKVDGATLTRLGSYGRYDYSVTRGTGQPTGVFKITFDTNTQSNNYAVVVTQQATGAAKIWETTTPTTSDFHIVTYSNSWTVINTVFHFTVFAGM